MTGRIASVVTISAHARGVAAPVRERLSALIREFGAGGLVLETCHRVELYATERDIPSSLVGSLPPGVVVRDGESAARHAIAVAVGLDSVVVGEDQVLHQLRSAIAAARTSGRLDPDVERLMNVALRAGRTARSWRTGPAPTLADAALEAARRRIVELRGALILVVGSGQMGRLAAQRASALGARVVIASRSRAHATSVALAVGAVSTTIDPGPAARDFEAVLVALRGPWILSPETVDALAGGSAVVVDLSMPSAVPGRLATALGDRLVSIDGLAAEPAAPGSRKDHDRMAALVDQSLAEFQRWADGRDRRATAEALVRRAEAERSAHLDRLWRSFPEIDHQARLAIEQMSRHLIERLLREPLERLGDDDDGRATVAARELFAL